MRVLLPWRVTSKKSTWVPKSVTSKRRSSAGGSMVWRKSTRTVRPCCRRSIPVAVSERSTMICASPFLPRRKSTSWTLCASLVGLVSENCVVVAAAAAAPLPCSVTTTVLPSILVSYLTSLARLNTTRVRPPAWPNRIVRRSPWLTSWVLLPRPFAVFGKSSATRGGLFTVKDAGGLGRASLRPSLTVTVPALCGDVDRLYDVAGTAVFRLGVLAVRSETAQHQQQTDRNGGQTDQTTEAFHFRVLLVYCSSNCKLLVRSVQDPDEESWMTSFRVTAESLMAVMTPKFCPSSCRP